MHNHTQGTSAPTTHLIFEGTALSIIDHSGQPWLAAADLARALDYSNPRSISNIYDRNRDEFTSEMTQVINTSTSGNINGLQHNRVRIFSPRGCHLLAMFARTDKAKLFRKWVLDVLDNVDLHTKTAKPDKASPELMNRLRDRIRMASHGFRYRHKAEAAFNARIRTATGAASTTKLTTAQCLHALDQIEFLEQGCSRYNKAVAAAEDKFLRKFVRGDSPMPLKPDLLLMEKDSSREILPIEASEADLRNLTNNAVGDEARMLLGHNTGEGEL